ncbi:phBC6A51 family helix-turn-helix protein [Lysinibacillus xylanilyticus]|uniref:phBC6A51 family helix-turn-helix protein n=1 Tax=Lysinibacillus xylanilyticus TaxID=582475 RepID=UPI003D04CEE5
MAKSSRQKALEAKLTTQQRKAAYLIVENEIKDNKDETKLEYQQIAEEVGVTYKTIWEWRTKNSNFIDYKNLIADDFLATERAAVYSNLMKLIKSPQPSVRAIDIYLRRFGLLTEKQVVTTESGEGARTDADLERELGELDELLKDDD